jgi:hypothetical protein
MEKYEDRMKIFVGYGYNANDKWIEDLVFPVIESFGFEVSTGKGLYGKKISNGVIERIRQSAALLVFLTRRDPMNAKSKFSTHRWCIEELITAIPDNIPAIEIREKNVESQDGMVFDKQRVEFDLNDKAALLVDVAKIVGQWKKELSSRTFTLFSASELKEKGYRNEVNEFECFYEFNVGDKEYGRYTAKPYLQHDGSLGVNIKYMPDSKLALIKIDLLYKKKKSWRLEAQSLHIQTVQLKKS